MRFAYNRGLPIFFGIFSLLISSAFIVLLAPTTNVSAAMPTCHSHPITKTHPVGGITANITITPSSNYDPLDIVLQDDSNNVKSTVKTCIPAAPAATPGVPQAHPPLLVQAFFPEVSAGKYMVCFKDNCTALFEKFNKSTPSVDLAVDGAEAPLPGGNVIVYVKINHKTTTEDTEYGNFAVTLTYLSSGRADLTENTGTAKKTKGDAGPTTVNAKFINVGPDLIKACIDSLNLCAGTEKENGVDGTITITVPEDKAKSLVSTAAGSGNTCGSLVSGMGWILCPVLNTLTGFNDLMWWLVQSLLLTNPLQPTGPVYQAWSTIRGLANVVFAIFFMVIIISQLTGAGITNYGIKKLLPRLIICAILVNASFIIIQLSTDLANIVGKGLYDMIMGMAPKVSTSWTSFVDGIIKTGAVASTSVVVGGAALLVASGSATALMWTIMAGAVMAALGFFAAVLTLAFRQAAIPILAILAPFAFVAYLLPNTEKWFKKWLDLLLPMLMLYPLAAIVFAGAQFSSQLLYAQGGWWFQLVGMVILALPLFSLPFLARSGGSILSAVGGQLNKIAENARKPLTEYGRERAEHAATAKRAYESQMVATKDERGITRMRRRAELRRDGKTPRTGLGKWTHETALDLAGKKERRLSDIDTNKSRWKSNWAESGRSSMGNGAEATQRSIHAKDRASAVASEAQNKHDDTTTPIADGMSGRQLVDRQALAKTNAEKIQTAAGIRQSLDPTHRALKSEVVGLKKDLTHETKAIESEQSRTVTGRQQDEQAINDENIAITDKERAAGRYESDPTTLQVRDDRAEAEAYTKSVRDDNAARVTAASAGEDPDYKFNPNLDPDPIKNARMNEEKRDAGRVAGMDAGMKKETIDMLQHAKRGSDVSTDASREATRKTEENYRKSVAGKNYRVGGYEKYDTAEYESGWVDSSGNPLLDPQGNPLVLLDRNGEPIYDLLDRKGNPIPVFDREGNLVDKNFDRKGNRIDENAMYRPTTETARMAAGIGGEAGVVRAQANALFAADKQDSEEVAARVVVQTNGIPAGKRPSLAKQYWLDAKAANDSVGMRAALETMMTTGEAGQSKLQDVLETIGPITPEQLASPEFEAIRDFQQALLKGGVKGFSISADKWAVMGGVRPIGEMQDEIKWYAGLKEPEVAAQSNAEFINMVKSGFLTPKRSGEVMKHPASQLSEGKRNLLAAISAAGGSKIPAGAELEYDGEIGRFKFQTGTNALNGQPIYTIL